MDAAAVIIVGITTSVRACAGIPREKSIRGNGCGVTSSVASQFTRPTANWLVATSRTATISHQPRRGARHPASARIPSAAVKPW